MSAMTSDHRIGSGYQLRLPGFEGPLDLLLRLVERQQLPISDVSLIAVCDQFLDAVATLGLAPEAMAEFAHVGSRLVLLKSRSLIPKPTIEDQDEDPSDLVVQLLEYKAVKEAAKQFAALDLLGLSAFARGLNAVNLPAKNPEASLARHEPRQLVRALSRRLLSQPVAPRLVTAKPVISLRIVVDHLLSRLTGRETRFSDLRLGLAGTVDDERALFLALLILVRRGQLDAQQDEPFSEIFISPVASAVEVDSVDYEEFSA